MNPTSLSSPAQVTLRILEFEIIRGLWGDNQTLVSDQGGINT